MFLLLLMKNYKSSCESSNSSTDNNIWICRNDSIQNLYSAACIFNYPCKSHYSGYSGLDRSSSLYRQKCSTDTAQHRQDFFSKGKSFRHKVNSPLTKFCNALEQCHSLILYYRQLICCKLHNVPQNRIQLLSDLYFHAVNSTLKDSDIA